MLDSASVGNGVSNYTVVGDAITYATGTSDTKDYVNYVSVEESTDSVHFDSNTDLNNTDGSLRRFVESGFPRLAESGVDLASGGNISATFTTDSIVDADHATEWQ